MADNNTLFLPDGLELEQIEPKWLTGLWPMTSMDSSIGSIIMTLGIYLVIAIAAVFLSYVVKATFPKILNRIVSLGLIAVTLAALASGALAFTTWAGKSPIGDEAMGTQVTKVTRWMAGQGVSADNRQAWNLVCHYYDQKNDNCDEDNVPVVVYRGQKEKVHLEKNNDGSVYLYVFADKVPLIE
ncbi:MAG: hypothetical protein H9W81_12660 [Enterococcus sp.]|nr:hypothetical protein [Enterococcus sp.]